MQCFKLGMIQKLSADAKMELFWKQSIGKVNGQLIWHSPSAVRITYSDASTCNTGMEGVWWNMVHVCMWHKGTG